MYPRSVMVTLALMRAASNQRRGMLHWTLSRDDGGKLSGVPTCLKTVDTTIPVSMTNEAAYAQGSATEPALGLNQGNYGVRLTGQDVERGTFNQRHAALFDQATGERCSVTLTIVARTPLSCAVVQDAFTTPDVFSTIVEPLLSRALLSSASVTQSS